MLGPARFGIFILVLCNAAAGGLAEDPVAVTPPRVDLIVVVGAAGEDRYADVFSNWSERLLGAVTAAGLQGLRLDQADALLTQLPQAAAVSTRDPLWLVFVGHGTATDGVAKFNLTGPDLSADQLQSALTGQQRPLVIVNTASSSGGFINALSGNDRVVVAATKSGLEQNFARFGDYFTAAITSGDGDLDHDGEISVLEAFLRAAGDVQRYYDTQDRIATEHAILDDNGDALGTPAKAYRGLRGADPSLTTIDGAVAKRITLIPAKQTVRLDASQRQEREQIESELERQVAAKPDTPDDAYWQTVGELMLRQARLYRAATQSSDQP